MQRRALSHWQGGLWLAFILFLGGWFVACSGGGGHKLPILGARSFSPETGDTLYHRVGDFRLLNQDSQWVTPQTFEDKVYVADFFFTSCPTICPVMAKNLLMVYEAYKDNKEVAILSHSIDPTYDSVAVLRAYADGLQVSSDSWHFVTGEPARMYALAKQYLSVALADSTAPGGYLHSGSFLLVDKEQRLRGVYDGTSMAATDSLMRDLEILLAEYR